MSRIAKLMLAGLVTAGLLLALRYAVFWLSTIEVTLALKLRNEPQLNALLKAQATKSSPLYQRYLTPEQFTETFSASKADVENLIKHMESKGLKVVRVEDNRLFITLSGSRYRFSKVFGNKITAGWLVATSVVPRPQPELPADLPAIVEGVGGFSDTELRSPLQAHADTTNTTVGGISPQQLSTAYNYPSPLNQTKPGTLTGKGVTIAILTAYKVTDEDLQGYFKKYNISRSGSIETILVGGKETSAGKETTLDVQQAAGLAPGADIAIYAAVNPGINTMNLALNRAVCANPHIITSSWGRCEKELDASEIKSQHNIFRQAAAQGIAVFCASGDLGIYDCGGPEMVVDYPSADHYVCGVGGTNLELNADSTRKDESVWHGSGSGLSRVFPRPWWQVGPGVPNTKGRLVCDISLLASQEIPGFAILFEGKWEVIGGTSASSPAFAALYAQACEAAGRRLGHPNPRFYRLVASDDYPKVFHDITKGNNSNSIGPGFAANERWDPPTGCGTPNGAPLVEWLKNN